MMSLTSHDGFWQKHLLTRDSRQDYGSCDWQEARLILNHLSLATTRVLLYMRRQLARMQVLGHRPKRVFRLMT